MKYVHRDQEIKFILHIAIELVVKLLEQQSQLTQEESSLKPATIKRDNIEYLTELLAFALNLATNNLRDIEEMKLRYKILKRCIRRNPVERHSYSKARSEVGTVGTTRSVIRALSQDIMH